MAHATNTVTITRVAIVGIAVNDQDRALAFYTGPLGLEARRDAGIAGGRRWIEVAPPGDAGATIALVAADGENPAGVETGIRLATPDAEETHAALRLAGVDVGDVLRWPGVPAMFAFRDPDGNAFSLTETGPGEAA